MNLTMKDLEECFARAKNEQWEYIGVEIQMEGFPESEVIINPHENFDAKLTYYQKAYNEDLTLKAFNGIKIVNFTCAEEYNEIENELILGSRY